MSSLIWRELERKSEKKKQPSRFKHITSRLAGLCSSHYASTSLCTTLLLASRISLLGHLSPVVTHSCNSFYCFTIVFSLAEQSLLFLQTKVIIRYLDWGRFKPLTCSFAVGPKVIEPLKDLKREFSNETEEKKCRITSKKFKIFIRTVFVEKIEERLDSVCLEKQFLSLFLSTWKTIFHLFFHRNF